MRYYDESKNICIDAGELEIGSNVKFGRDVKIKVHGKLSIGNNSIIGDRFTATAEEIKIGEYFYNGPTDSRGMVIGGGGANFPYSKLSIGDRVVCHTGHINLAAPVSVGNDVGLSHDVDLITHGFWYSVLKGYPRSVKGINIGNNVILGWKTVIMMGVDICDNVVIGAHSTVVRSISDKGIYAGSPAKFIKRIEEPEYYQKVKMLDDIVVDFKNLIEYYDVEKCNIEISYPTVQINDLTIDVETFKSFGEHDVISDAFRDFIRRYGIRVFAPHGFNFKLIRK